MWRKTLVLTVALLAAVGCGDGGDKTTTASQVTRENLVISTRSAGELKAVSSVDLVAPPSRGRLRIARLAPDGMEIPPGMPVVSFDTEEVAKELRDRQSDLGTAEKELEQATLEAKSESERLAVDLERTEIGLDKARIKAAKDPAVAKANEIRKARADVAALVIAAEQKRRALELAKRRHRKTQRSLAAKIKKAEQDQKLAQAQLESLTLKAPVGGTVLLAETWGGGTMRKFQTGDSAWSGQVVASLPDLTKMEALLYVEEADIETVHLGQSVSIRLDAAPERSFAARIDTISILAESLSWNDPAKVFKVVATLDETDPELMRPGLRLQAEIEVERHDDVITVPLELVAEVDGKTFVTLASGDRREVALGARNDDRVIVEHGLDEGASLRPPEAS